MSDAEDNIDEQEQEEEKQVVEQVAKEPKKKRARLVKVPLVKKQKPKPKEAVEEVEDNDPVVETEEVSTLRAENRLLQAQLNRWRKNALDATMHLDLANAKVEHSTEQLKVWLARAVAAESDLQTIKDVNAAIKRHDETADDHPPKKAKTAANNNNNRHHEDEVEDIEDDDEPVVKMSINEKKADASDTAQVFLRTKWLDVRKSFERRKSSDVYKEYCHWCTARGARNTLSHKGFSTLMRTLMPNGYVTGRAGHNQAIVTFNWELAQADIQAQNDDKEKAAQKDE